MSRNQQNFITTFMDLTGACKEEATLYAKRFSNIDDAINRYYDDPLPFTAPKPAAPVASETSTYSKKFIATFEKHINETGDMKEDDVEAFYEELGMQSEAIYDYVLFFVSGAKALQSFKRADIIEICKKIPFSGDYGKDIKQYFKDFILKKQLRSFLSRIHAGLLNLIKKINEANNIKDERGPKQLEKSHQKRTENMIVLVDLIPDVFSEMYGADIIEQNVCFTLFMKYIIEVREIQSISLEDFEFIDYFIKTFKTEKDLKKTESQVQEMETSLSLLGEDFIRYYNKLAPSK